MWCEARTYHLHSRPAPSSRCWLGCLVLWLVAVHAWPMRRSSGYHVWCRHTGKVTYRFMWGTDGGAGGITAAIRVSTGKGVVLYDALRVLARVPGTRSFFVGSNDNAALPLPRRRGCTSLSVHLAKGLPPCFCAVRSVNGVCRHRYDTEVSSMQHCGCLMHFKICVSGKRLSCRFCVIGVCGTYGTQEY
jgi:hypothetical protein